MNSKDEFRAAQSTEDMPPTTTHPPTIPPAIPSQPEMEHEAPVQASHSSESWLQFRLGLELATKNKCP